MSASDPLMSHTGIDQDNASASYFLIPQTDNGQGSASAPDLLMSRGAVDDNDMTEEFNIFDRNMTEEFNIFDRNIIEDLNKLHNDHDNTVNLNETFFVHEDSTEEAALFLLHSRGQRRVRRRPVQLHDFVEYNTHFSIYVQNVYSFY
jgi:hypothetical protein